MPSTADPRVLVYRDFLLPPSETFIRTQAEGLKRFEAHYLGLRTIQGLSLPPERVHTIQRDGLVGRATNGLFRFTGMTPLALWQVARLRPRLVHAHFGLDATRIMRLARYLRLPLIATFHDYDITTSDADLLKLMPYAATYIRRRPALAAQASAFLAVSEFLKQKAIDRGFPAHKIRVHYIGIDTERFSSADAAAREPIVLFVGRLVAKKGCDDLIAAMAKVQASHPDVELVVIGDGELRAKLEREAGQHLKRHRFLGTRGPDEVRAWQARARVFCAPSVTAPSGETEGLPISIMEALASATPVVSTRHAGIPEAVLDERTGLLVDEHDRDGLADRLGRLLRDPSLAASLGREGRRVACERFDLRKQIAALEDIYDEVSRAHRV